MVMHKMITEIKHKELEPWEAHPPGSAKPNRYPDGFDLHGYRSHRDSDSFAWMLYWAMQDSSKIDLQGTLNYWWSFVHSKTFPEGGATVADLSDNIFQRLIDNGHESNRLEYTEKEYSLPTFILKNAQWNIVKERIVHHIQPEEAEMAKIFLKPKGGVLPPKNVPAVSAKRESTPREEGVPKWVTSSRPGTKAHDSKIRICELLMEQKHSDSEISLIIESELEYNVSTERINFYRYTLNKGRFAPLGFEKPAKDIEEIKKSSGAITPPAQKVGLKVMPKGKVPAVPAAPVVKKLFLKKK